MCTLLLLHPSTLRPLHEIIMTRMVYVIFKAERALLILRLTQHCTFPHENREHQKTGANVIHRQKLYGRLSPFILHLTWEGTLMWNCLMIYCDWCLNACASISRRSPVFYLFFSVSVCVSPERAL